MEITNITKKRIREYIGQGKRFDGRELLAYRPISIKTNISNQAEGSAEVCMGNTRVLAGVKLEIAEPYPDSQDSGNLMVTTELLPLSSEQFRPGPPSVQAIELARIVDRGLRESEFVDFKKLCITKGEKVWALMIDIYPLNDDGNLIDAAALAAMAALSSTVFPVVKDEKIAYGEFTDKKLPLTKNMPLTMTFYKVGKSIILDPVTMEENVADARVSIAISDDKEPIVNAVQKSDMENIDSALTKEDTFKIIDLAVKEQKKLRKVFEEQTGTK